jgi:glycosyltransferase involved in cell wall biosynthesis
MRIKISIVVPAFNEEKLIERSLQNIRAAAITFSQVGWEHEIIVCDNNSTDRTAELAQAQGACVVFEPVNQISRARNAGAAAAKGTVDCFCRRGFFSQHRTVCRSGGAN